MRKIKKKTKEREIKKEKYSQIIYKREKMKLRSKIISKVLN